MNRKAGSRQTSTNQGQGAEGGGPGAQCCEAEGLGAHTTASAQPVSTAEEGHGTEPVAVGGHSVTDAALSGSVAIKRRSRLGQVATGKVIQR